MEPVETCIAAPEMTPWEEDSALLTLAAPARPMPCRDMATSIRILALLALYGVWLQTPAKGHPIQKQCHISKYKNTKPSVMSIARELQDLQRRRRSCHLGLRLRNFTDCDLKGKERLMLTLHRLSLAISVLEDMNQTKLVIQNLEAFSILQADLMNCEGAKSPELKNCQHHLNQYRDKVTKECLENDVLLSLVWLLTEDLGYLIYGEQSAEGKEKMELPVTTEPLAAKKNRGKKRKKSKKNKKNAN
ncbi:interferon lambda-2 [Eleutherodactylus coqui]|uniref:interferon lambda-2 n=1 Tax=Eleutherodactylus coqui TaxID=57060 RepID=UPI003463780A